MAAKRKKRATVAAMTKAHARKMRKGKRRHKRNPSAARAKEEDRALRHYKELHWGDRGASTAIKPGAAGDPTDGVLAELGELSRIEYDTRKKGDPELTTYFHDFGNPKPKLAVTHDGYLVIVGGRYRVKERGIVG